MPQDNKNNIFFNASWLFLIDIEIDTSLKSYKDYEKIESGYSATILEAYREAFKLPFTKDLIKQIHKVAAAHLPIIRGETNSPYTHFFPLIFPEMIFSSEILERTEGSNATINGLHQLITSWFNSDECVHSLVIGEQTKTQVIVYPYNPRTEQKGIWVYDIEKSSMFKYDRTVLDSYKNRLSRNYDRAKICVGKYIYPAGIDIVSFRNKKLEALYEEFTNQIVNAKDDAQKLKCIARYIQKIDQLHPFQDGNLRSCYILLNRILHEYGLPFSLLINPNRIDAYTLEELVDVIKHGQEFFLKAFTEKVSSYKPYLPSFNVVNIYINANQELIASFHEIIEKNLSHRIKIEKHNRLNPELDLTNSSTLNRESSPLVNNGFFIKKQSGYSEKKNLQRDRIVTRKRIF